MSSSVINSVKNYIELGKPRITVFCLMMTAGGALLANNKISFVTLILTFIGTTFTVSAANTFNMIYERESDKHMKRTQFRPLVVGKMGVPQALVFAIVLAIMGTFLLAFYVNILTAALSLFAVFFYAAIYTPLKSRTPLALVIGAVPGAMPPLLGWTAADNEITLPSLALFSVLFAWQMPHFIAIALNHQVDYTKAGIKVLPAVRGELVAKIQALLWTVVLIAASLSLVYFNLGGKIYYCFAVVLGAWYLYLSVIGLTHPEQTWAKKFFFASLIYLPSLVLGLALDRLVYFWGLL